MTSEETYRLSSPKRKLDRDKNDLNKHWKIIGKYSLVAEKRNTYMQMGIVLWRISAHQRRLVSALE